MRSLIRILRYLGAYRVQVFGSLALLLFSTGLNLTQPKFVEWAVDFGISVGEIRSVVIAAMGIFVTALFGAGANFASGVLLVKAGQGMGFQMRNALFKKVLSFSFADLDTWRTGELLVRINSDVNTVRMFIRMGLLMIVQSVIMLVGSVIVMLFTNARLSIIMIVILPATLLFFFLSASFIRPLFLKVRRRLDEVNNVIQENIAGAKVVRAFARRKHEQGRFDRRNSDFLALSLKVGYIVAITFPFLFFLGQLAIVLVSWFGGVQVIENVLDPTAYGLTLGQLLAFNNYALMAMWPIMALGMVLNFISRASASAQRIEELLAEKPDIRDRRDARRPVRLAGAVEFRNVTFAYGAGENALDGIDLTIAAGEKIGILGRTGAGKSSLAYLIPRFYEPASGSVLVDGADVRDISVASLRERISLVLQESILMSGTVRENIGFARPDASEDEYRRAARIACADEFIEEKEDGWDEPVGERGTGLSGGQRQRVAIARAILSDPDIIILDDVTSSVDAHTERRIVTNLYSALKDKTVIIISQKINTIMLADRIIVLDGGRIIGVGTHDELVDASPMYREIFETQSAEIRA